MAKSGKRWRIEVDRGNWVSVCGPDYERDTEFRVIDTRTGETVMTFHESGEWPYMCGEQFSGTQSVELAPDGEHLIVTDHDTGVRTIPLPR